MNHVQSTLIAAAFGATFGIITIAGMLLYQKFVKNQVYTMRNNGFDAVNQKLSELEHELQQLRLQQNQQRRKRKNAARRHVSNDSTYTATTNDTDIDAYSTVGTDIGDDEFFDCSDSEDTAENEDRTTEAMNHLDTVLAEIDQCTVLEEKLEENTYYKLRRLANLYPENVDVIWKFAKASYDYSTSLNKTQMKQSIIQEGILSCQKLLEKYSPESADFHKWYALLIGVYCEHLPMGEKVKHAYKFRDHVTKALELRPTDSTLHHLIGRFKYELSDLSWIERKLAAAVFSEPPNATYEEAIESFEQAETLGETPHLENRLFLAKAYIALCQYPTAVHWLEQATEPLAATEKDSKIQAEAKELLKTYT